MISCLKNAHRCLSKTHLSLNSDIVALPTDTALPGPWMSYIVNTITELSNRLGKVTGSTIDWFHLRSAGQPCRRALRVRPSKVFMSGAKRQGSDTVGNQLAADIEIRETAEMSWSPADCGRAGPHPTHSFCPG